MLENRESQKMLCSDDLWMAFMNGKEKTESHVRVMSRKSADRETGK